MKNRRHVLLYSFACTCLALVFCSVQLTYSLEEPSDLVLIDDVPHVLQKDDFRGEACIAMYLSKLGHDTTQDHVFNLAELDPALGRGCFTREMVIVLKKIGFKPGKTWYRIDPEKSEREIDDQWNKLLSDLQNDIPSIVCMHYDDNPETTEHFRLVVGYDSESDEVIYHEPAEEDGAYRRMDRSMFLKLWPLKYRRNEWTVIRMALEAGEIDLGGPAEGYTAADFAQHVMALKPNVPEGFTIVVQPPFVVIGDEKPAIVNVRAERTVKWFSDQMKKLYFPKNPPEIFDIWLFKNNTSYRKHAKELFDDEPDTPYGYFSYANGALVMNIGTGGGTLCHELVHAFMPSNFPECPAWFNEGLGSLYEQSGERDGSAVGLTNWRLAGLKRVIKADALPSFRALCSTTTHQFYNMTSGDNYAQARYLCYYLQEKKLLKKFFEEFRKNVEDDPSGYATLKKILGIRSESDMQKFQTRWEKWVLGLKFP